MLDRTLLMQTLKDIVETGERLSNESEKRAFDVLAQDFKKAGALVQLEKVPLFVSTVDNVELKVNGQAIFGLGNAMTLPLSGEECRQGSVEVRGTLRVLETEQWKIFRPKTPDEIILLRGLANIGDLRKAHNLGVKAVLFDTGERIHRMIVSEVWGSPIPGNEKCYVQTPNACICHKDAAQLRDGMPVELKLTINSRWTASTVLTAKINQNTDNPDALTAIVTAHIDSWGAGAVDNASGIAAMVASAEAIGQIQRRSHHVCYVVWSGHSHGRYAGSTAWSDKHADWLNREVFLNLNCDCLGMAGSTILGKTPVMACTASLAREAHKGHQFKEHFTRFNRSCDQSFLWLGIPSVFSNISEVPPTPGVSLKVAGLSGAYGPYWHSNDDTLQAIDPDALVRDAEIFTAALSNAVIKGCDCLDLVAEWNDFQSAIEAKVKKVMSIEPEDAVTAAFLTVPIWPELLAKIDEKSKRIQVLNQSTNPREKLRCLKMIVSMEYSSAAIGFQDPAGLKASDAFSAAYDLWEEATVGSFGYYSAWTQMVKGANNLLFKLNEL